VAGAWRAGPGGAGGDRPGGRSKSHRQVQRTAGQLRIYQNACDITAAANALAADGHPVDPDDLATIVPCITHTIRRFGDWVLDLSPPQALPVTTLNLAPGAATASGPPPDGFSGR